MGWSDPRRAQLEARADQEHHDPNHGVLPGTRRRGIVGRRDSSTRRQPGPVARSGARRIARGTAFPRDDNQLGSSLRPHSQRSVAISSGAARDRTPRAGTSRTQRVIHDHRARSPSVSITGPAADADSPVTGKSTRVRLPAELPGQPDPYEQGSFRPTFPLRSWLLASAHQRTQFGQCSVEHLSAGGAIGLDPGQGTRNHSGPTLWVGARISRISTAISLVSQCTRTPEATSETLSRRPIRRGRRHISRFEELLDE